MKLIRDFSSHPPRGAVIALGNFDGVHLGHQAILRRCLEIAKAEGVPSAVMTFEPHPREFFARDNEKLRLYPLRRKLELLRGFGMDAVFLARFSRAFASLSAESFVTDILHKQLAARHVVTGVNFAFGKARGGTTEFLGGEARRLGFGFTACLPVHDENGQIVSSSAIRKLLAGGDVRNAAALLGRPYSIAGKITHGDKRGRELGFPTANILLAKLFKPRFGIYAVRIHLEGTWHGGVASLGVRPMFDGREPLLEVHVFDTSRDMYGSYAQVEFVEFLREEKRFDTTDALCAQMAEDCLKAKEVLYAHR